MGERNRIVTEAEDHEIGLSLWGILLGKGVDVDKIDDLVDEIMRSVYDDLGLVLEEMQQEGE